RRITGVLGSVATLLMASHSAAICGPHVDARYSTVPKCFVGCPAGDVSFTVAVRDGAGNPSVAADVILDFSSCPEVKLCPIQELGTGISGPRALRITDNAGMVVFHLAVGGLCPSAIVHLTANGVPLGDLPVANLDQDGDLQVIAADQALASAKVGGTDPS